MHFRFVWPGRTKDERLRSLVAEYLKRLSRFTKCEIVEIRESTGNEPAAKARDARRLLDAVSAEAFLVLLDEGGRELSSTELADQIRRWENDSVKEVAVVIGGPDGVHEEVKSRADAQWSLSRLTLTHEMARVLLVEQIYRAYTINRGMPYQK